MKLYCTHVRCRIDTLAELAYLMESKGVRMSDAEIRSRYL